MNESLIFTFFLFFLFTHASSQPNLLKSAEQEFELKNYTKAIFLYQKALKGEEVNNENSLIFKKNWRLFCLT